MSKKKSSRFWILMLSLLGITGVYFLMPERIHAQNATNASVTPVVSTSGEAVKGEAKKWFVNENAINVRSEPSEKGKKVLKILKGTEVEVLETQKDSAGNEWKKITVDKTEGWVKGSFLISERKNTMKFVSLDYTPQNKVKEYPNNPKVKVKGIYLTVFSAGGKRLDSLIEMTKKTEINAFVIDIKDDDGRALFNLKASEKYAPKANKFNTVKDIAALVKKCKENKIYLIGRIVTFKDPEYTAAHPEKAIINKTTGKPYTNADNLRWASPYDRELWNYDVECAKEAAAAGFNEIQFDYVRFPASNGGKLDKILDYRNDKNETKPQAIQEFLKFAHKELSPMNVYTSADIFGLVGSVTDDMALGQYWEAVSNVVDYVCPMMYPSHYANGTYGLKVPDAFPYECVYKSTKDSVARNKNIPTPAIIRPWIQDFSAAWVKGHIKYGKAQVEGQIRALKENGVDEYLLWNANNRYTESAIAK